MKRPFIFYILVLVLYGPLQSQQKSRTCIENPLNLARQLADIKLGVVSIHSYFSENGRKWSRIGSGFIYGKEGFILTRKGVVENGDSVIVTFSNDRKYHGQVLYHHSDYGLSVLKTDVQISNQIKMGNTSELDFQSKLTILGNSLGIFPSLTLATYVGKRSDGMLRLSAEIPPGNCGSPVLNENGQLIGLLAGRVLEADDDTKDDLFSIALPIEEINSVITDFRTLLKDQKGWAGLSVVDMSNTEIKGVRIVYVVPNGPSAKAELCEGDTLVQFEGQWVENARQVAKWVKSRKPEEEVLFTVKKKGHFINRAVQLSYPVIYTKNIDN